MNLNALEVTLLLAITRSENQLSSQAKDKNASDRDGLRESLQKPQVPAAENAAGTSATDCRRCLDYAELTALPETQRLKPCSAGSLCHSKQGPLLQMAANKKARDERGLRKNRQYFSTNIIAQKSSVKRRCGGPRRDEQGPRRFEI